MTFSKVATQGLIIPVYDPTAQLQKSINTIQGLNYPAAITSLDSQNTTLSAAMQAYTLTEGLSLFKYLS